MLSGLLNSSEIASRSRSLRQHPSRSLRIKNGDPTGGAAPGARILSRSSRMIVRTAATNSAGARSSASIRICAISGDLLITVRRGSPTITGAHLRQVASAIRVYPSDDTCLSKIKARKPAISLHWRGMGSRPSQASVVVWASTKYRSAVATMRRRSVSSASPHPGIVVMK